MTGRAIFRQPDAGIHVTFTPEVRRRIRGCTGVRHQSNCQSLRQGNWTHVPIQEELAQLPTMEDFATRCHSSNQFLLTQFTNSIHLRTIHDGRRRETRDAIGSRFRINRGAGTRCHGCGRPRTVTAADLGTAGGGQSQPCFQKVSVFESTPVRGLRQR